VVRRLADQLVMALSHASLFRDLDELGWGALRALARAIDANSPWTAGHSERVGLVAAAIGRELGLEPRQLDCLHRGGLLHDVGKIGVPADILNKPGRLTPAELEKVRAHPAMGATILAPIQAYQDLLPLVRSHHELLDGSGYPEGLVGGQIPPLVRVLTVADIFDALVSDRPYRDAWNARKAIDYIAGGAGVTFDPQVVDAFRAVVFQGSADLWRAYPMLERQLAREAGFARTGTRQKVGRPW
jgi:HD-GYP domain-containing protein (c-di-GMP phosphodiesterase class II)